MKLLPVMSPDGTVVAYVQHEDAAPAKAKRAYKKRASKTQRLQGKYLASMRALSKADRLKARAVLKKQGHVSAIKFAKELAAKT